MDRGADAAGLRVLVVTVVHDPEDARIRHRQLVSLLDAGALVTYAAPFSAYGRTPPPGVRGIDLPRATGRRRLRALVTATRFVRAQARTQDVVLVHDPDLLPALWAVPARSGVVRVWDVHEDTAAALGMRGWVPAGLRRPLAAAVGLLERRAERTLHLLLAEEGYAQRFSRPHPLVPNSSWVPVDEPPAPGDDRAVYLGRLTLARGAAELVELGRRLAGDVRVDLVGPADPDCADLVRQAHERGWVHHHGFVPNAAAVLALRGATAGLSLLHDEPNYNHSRPTKIMEYMAQGLPVVTTPNDASRAVVERFGCGVVVGFGDVAGTEAAVRALAADPARRRALAAAGRRGALEHLDWRRDGERFAATLAGWAGRPAGEPVPSR